MSTKRLLYFTAEEHFVYRASGRTLELEVKFPADESGVAAFREYLTGQRKGSLFGLLADLAGEDFHEDQLPYLRGGDRQAIVQRRLAQRYRDTRLAAALSLGVVSSERRNERLLLASFTNTQQFTPWLDALSEAGARLAGVYSVPIVAPALAARLGVVSGRCIVVSVNRAGLRQSFIDEGKLRFARLERTTEMAPEALAAIVRSETLRLTQYLTTLRAIPRDGPPMQVVAVAPSGALAAFERLLVSDSRLTFHVMDINAAVRKVGLRSLPGGMLAEAAYLQLAAKRPPKEQFAQSEDRRSFVLWQLQRYVLAAGAAAFAVCALFAGARWIDVLNVRDQTLAQAREARAADAEYRRITASFPVTQTTTDNLKATVVEFQRLAARTATPNAAMAFLALGLERFPEIELESLAWSVGQSAESAKGSTAPSAAGTGAVSEFLEISGRVQSAQRSDYRAITELVQRFGATLGSGPVFRVQRMRLPFDISSEGTLTGDVGSMQSNEAPRFTLVLARPVK